MKILVVEDDILKRLYVEDVLKRRKIDTHFCRSVRPAIRYALRNSGEINGIILDLGLTSYDNSDDYDFKKGLELVKELTRKEVKIPILINSTSYIELEEIMKENPNVKGQMYVEDDYSLLRWFINLLEKEEQ